MSREALIATLAQTKELWLAEVDTAIRRRLNIIHESVRPKIRQKGDRIPSPDQWEEGKPHSYQRGSFVESPTHRLSWVVNVDLEQLDIHQSGFAIDVDLVSRRKKEGETDGIFLTYSMSDRKWAFGYDRYRERPDLAIRVEEEDGFRIIRQCIDPKQAELETTGFGDALEFNVRRILTQHEIVFTPRNLPEDGTVLDQEVISDPFDPLHYVSDFREVHLIVALRILTCMVNEFEQTLYASPRKKK